MRAGKLIFRPKQSRQEAKHRLRSCHGRVRFPPGLYSPRLRRLRRLRGVQGRFDGRVERGRGGAGEKGGGEARKAGP